MSTFDGAFKSPSRDAVRRFRRTLAVAGKDALRVGGLLTAILASMAVVLCIAVALYAYARPIYWFVLACLVLALVEIVLGLALTVLLCFAADWWSDCREHAEAERDA